MALPMVGNVTTPVVGFTDMPGAFVKGLPPRSASVAMRKDSGLPSGSLAGSVKVAAACPVGRFTTGGRVDTGELLGTAAKLASTVVLTYQGVSALLSRVEIRLVPVKKAV